MTNDLTRCRFLSAGAAASVAALPAPGLASGVAGPAEIPQRKFADRTQMEYFNGRHTINGQGTFEFLARHLA